MANFKVLILLLAVVASSSAITLQCRFFDFQWLIVGNRYSCEATVLNSGTSQNITNVIGTHLAEKSDINVEVLTVTNERTLTQLPTDIDGFFPNLVIFQWVIGGLTTISAADLKAFPNLQILSVHFNSFTRLDADLFVNTPKLQWISFTDNSIESVGENLITNLKELKIANFQNNRCVSLNASSPQGLSELRLRLTTQCSPAQTTTELPNNSTLPIECLSSSETDQLRAENKALNAKVAELQRLIRNQA